VARSYPLLRDTGGRKGGGVEEERLCISVFKSFQTEEEGAAYVFYFCRSLGERFGVVHVLNCS